MHAYQVELNVKIFNLIIITNSWQIKEYKLKEKTHKLRDMMYSNKWKYANHLTYMLAPKPRSPPPLPPPVVL